VARRAAHPPQARLTAWPCAGEDKRGDAGSRKLFARKQDGTFLLLTCPVCGRDRFINQLGFLNHMRIVHQLAYASYLEAALVCGVPVVRHRRSAPRVARDAAAGRRRCARRRRGAHARPG
jgi:hypothetical protein